MSVIQIDVLEREERKKNKMKKIRKEGRIPAIVYGKNIDPLSISLDLKTLVKEYRNSPYGKNALIELNIKGAEGDRTQSVVSQDMDIDPMTQNIIHLDFVAVDSDTLMIYEIPLRFEGAPKGQKMGGVLIHNLNNTEFQKSLSL